MTVWILPLPVKRLSCFLMIWSSVRLCGKTVTDRNPGNMTVVTQRVKAKEGPRGKSMNSEAGGISLHPE